MKRMFVNKNTRFIAGIFIVLILSFPLYGNRGVWVTRWDYSSVSDQNIIDKCLKYKISDIFVQIYARGYAFYDSRYVPSKLHDYKFKKLIKLAHGNNIKVHAWINMYYVWSWSKFPDDPMHIVNRHRDWITAYKNGKELYKYDIEGIKNLGLEGYFISPANMDANRFLKMVINEIITKFNVDGINLDYIRYPGLNYGYDKYTRSYFMQIYGIDPMNNNYPFPYDRKKLMNLFDSWKENVLNNYIREIHKITSEKGVLLSASVLSGPVYAKRYFSQDWTTWLNRRYVDFVIPMLYTKKMGFFNKRLNELRKYYGNNNIWIGIGSYMLSPSQNRYEENIVYRKHYDSVVYFSYNSLK